MLRPVCDSSCNKFFKRFDSPTLKTGCITALALVAIGLITVGSLGIVAALNPSAWAVLSNLGMHTSVSLLAAGTVSLFVAAFLRWLCGRPSPSQDVFELKTVKFVESPTRRGSHASPDYTPYKPPRPADWEQQQFKENTYD